MNGAEEGAGERRHGWCRRAAGRPDKEHLHLTANVLKCNNVFPTSYTPTGDPGATSPSACELANTVPTTTESPSASTEKGGGGDMARGPQAVGPRKSHRAGGSGGRYVAPGLRHHVARPNRPPFPLFGTEHQRRAFRVAYAWRHTITHTQNTQCDPHPIPGKKWTETVQKKSKSGTASPPPQAAAAQPPSIRLHNISTRR